MIKYRIYCLLLAVALLGLPPFPASAAEASDLHSRARDMKKLNGDTVGWLTVPGTEIDDVVLQRAGDMNAYYLRRDFEGRYSFGGSFFADFRCVFPPGEPSRNTVIYGNTFADDPDGEHFAQLLRYKDAKFAAENPVIYFATTEETAAWEVFAVSVMTADVPYNDPALPDAEHMDVVEKVRASSVHPFAHIEVTARDEILTLSTTDLSGSKPYPNPSRYVVMAKQMEPVAAPAPFGGATGNPGTGR